MNWKNCGLSVEAVGWNERRYIVALVDYYLHEGRSTWAAWHQDDPLGLRTNIGDEFPTQEEAIQAAEMHNQRRAEARKALGEDKNDSTRQQMAADSTKGGNHGEREAR